MQPQTVSLVCMDNGGVRLAPEDDFYMCVKYNKFPFVILIEKEEIDFVTNLPAYQEFRDKLLEAGYGIKCNGSRLNAVQSGMMETTDKIYLVEMGRQALMKDIVHIWDYADIDTFPDTKQQNEFFQQWAKR